MEFGYLLLKIIFVLRFCGELTSQFIDDLHVRIAQNNPMQFTMPMNLTMMKMIMILNWLKRLDRHLESDFDPMKHLTYVNGN